MPAPGQTSAPLECTDARGLLVFPRACHTLVKASKAFKRLLLAHHPFVPLYVTSHASQLPLMLSWHTVSTTASALRVPTRLQLSLQRRMAANATTAPAAALAAQSATSSWVASRCGLARWVSYSMSCQRQGQGRWRNERSNQGASARWSEARGRDAPRSVACGLSHC